MIPLILAAVGGWLIGDSVEPKKFKAGGLIAPNGKKSNLTPQEYKLVRTLEFKAWFGDWENSPETASKIVDENGEPLVLHHGTRGRFNIFDIDKSGESNTIAKVGFWFTPKYSFAYNFADSSWWGGKSDAFVYSVFLSIKNPKIYYSSAEKEVVYSVLENGEIYRDGLTMTEAKKMAQELNSYNFSFDTIYEKYSVSSNYERYSDSYEKFKTDIYEIAGQDADDANIGGIGMMLNNSKETIKKYRELLASQGFDGIIIKNTKFDRGEAGGYNDQYVALESNQIKLANGINRTFDSSNSDIRYKEGGLLATPSRLHIPSIIGEWNKNKILKYLKERKSESGSTYGISKVISDFDTVDEFADHIYYHGTVNNVSEGLKPSITLTEKQAAEMGGGGYGDRYWGISLTKRKRTAESFSGKSSYVNIYPVILKSDAKVIYREDLQDAADIEDIIVDLYNDGVDAVWIGGGEEELVLVNPFAAIIYKNGYEQYSLIGGFKSQQLTREQIEALYKEGKMIYEDVSERIKGKNRAEREEILSSINKLIFKKGGKI